MRLLLTLVIAAALGWSAYWYIAATSMQSGLNTWLEARRTEGWVAEVSDISIAGFPNRVDTSLSGLELADPGTGLAWQASLVQILALSYRPNHVIMAFPPEQRFASPYDKFEITSDDMRASLVLEPNTDLTLARMTLTADNLGITLQGEGDSTELSALSLAAERTAADPAPTYRLGLRADGFRPSLPWRAQLDPGNSLPEALDALNADLTVTFDTPWNRFAIENARPQPRMIKLRLAEARWGQLELQLAGQLSVDDTGRPEGQLTVKARNWRDILALGVSSGALPQGLASSLEDGLGLIAQLAGNPNTLDVPLDFTRGKVFLGPIPIGPAPVLRIR